MKIRINNQKELNREINKVNKPYYVYFLCHKKDGKEIPFYIGIGQDLRLFAHEKEARESDKKNAKLDLIRELRRTNKEVIRYIDDFYEEVPWHRESDLINKWGLLKDGTGILTNFQRYTSSNIDDKDKVELRKYAELGDNLPSNFISQHKKLNPGPNKPESKVSVYGKIYRVLFENPGITGEQLVYLLLEEDFSKNKSAYTQNGSVNLPWLAKYVDGGFYQKNLFIQEASPNSCSNKN